MNASTALDSPLPAAWHMRAHFSIEAIGKEPAKDGTMEVWSSGTDLRTVTVVDGTTFVVVRHDGEVFVSVPVTTDLVLAQEMLGRLLHPGPLDDELAAAGKVVEKPRSSGKAKANCVQEDFGLRENEDIFGITSTAYCLSPDDGSYLGTLGPAERTWDALQLGTFQNKRVITKLELRVSGKQKQSMLVDSLKAEAPAADAFATDGLTAVDELPEMSGPSLLPALVLQAAPQYPAAAKERHTEGSVHFNGVLGSDGRLGSLTPNRGADPTLVAAGSAALKVWRYRPFVLNAVPLPTPVDIVMNFNLR